MPGVAEVATIGGFVRQYLGATCIERDLSPDSGEFPYGHRGGRRRDRLGLRRGRRDLPPRSRMGLVNSGGGAEAAELKPTM